MSRQQDYTSENLGLIKLVTFSCGLHNAKLQCRPQNEFFVFAGEFLRKSFCCVPRHSDCMFPTCDLTTSIISPWSVDSGIKGCLWKAAVSVWEHSGWPWHVMTVCHLQRLAGITVIRVLQALHTTSPLPWTAGKHVLKTCLSPCYESYHGALWLRVKKICLRGQSCQGVSEVFTWSYAKL